MNRKWLFPFPLAASDSGLQALSLDVLFVDDSEIQALNRLHRSKDKATDVLSFSQLEGESVGASAGEQILPFPLPLGDIVISEDTAARQALARGSTFGEEILRLAVHGVLHLFGYDHEGVSEEEACAMEAEEDDILARFKETAVQLTVP